MGNRLKIAKRALALIFVLILSINSFGAISSDNDGSSFITKAEFDSLKNTFQSQIDSYNQGIDSKIDNAIAAYLSGIRIATEVQIDNAWGQDKYCTLLEGIDVTDIKPCKFGIDWKINALSIGNGNGYSTTVFYMAVKRDVKENNEFFVVKNLSEGKWVVRKYTKKGTCNLSATGTSTLTTNWGAYSVGEDTQAVWRSGYVHTSGTCPTKLSVDEIVAKGTNVRPWSVIWGAPHAIMVSLAISNARYPFRYAKESKAEDPTGAVGVFFADFNNSFELPSINDDYTSDFIMLPAELCAGATNFFIEVPETNRVSNDEIRALEIPNCYDDTIERWGFRTPGGNDVTVTGKWGGYGHGTATYETGSYLYRNFNIDGWKAGYDTTGAHPESFEAVPANPVATAYNEWWWEWYINPKTIGVDKIQNDLSDINESDRTSNDFKLNSGLLIFHNTGKEYKSCEFTIDTSNLSKRFKIGLSNKVFGTDNSDTHRAVGNYIPFTIGSQNYSGWSEYLDADSVTITANCSNSESIYLTLKYEPGGDTCKHEIFKLNQKVKCQLQ